MLLVFCCFRLLEKTSEPESRRKPDILLLMLIAFENVLFFHDVLTM